jgi:hypothetical protein
MHKGAQKFGNKGLRGYEKLQEILEGHHATGEFALSSPGVRRRKRPPSQDHSDENYPYCTLMIPRIQQTQSSESLSK